MGRVRRFQSGARPAVRGARGGGAGAAGVGGGSGRHADRSVPGGGAARRRLRAATAGDGGSGVPAAARHPAGERAVHSRSWEPSRGRSFEDARRRCECGRCARLGRAHGGRPCPRGAARAGVPVRARAGGAAAARGGARDGNTEHARVVVHFSTRGDDGRWAVELREPDGSGTTRARAGGPEGTRVALPGGRSLVLEELLSERSARLWWARGPVGVPELLREHGRPIRYAYTERDQPLSAYQTVFALPSPDGAGSAEMPSAGRPFTDRLVAEAVSRGVQFAPVTLHTGVASAEAHEPPYPERFSVPEASARLINAARAGGGRVVAVGTTAVRAVESAADGAGVVRAAAGWTDLVLTPERGVRVVSGVLTGLHEPTASHLSLLAAIAGKAAVTAGYREAVRRRYHWHEFGDSHLIFKA
ncbi:S-adenosylmethionine:tRNA ribosyltransferase-isomerase [Streptomyces cavernicola]|uniref:S-adenosylmethionine:tRNA ribosyltransferase-isomerase n=1 Tax=Streptomyces cavernicola TaxID=3043613 RepID=UPI0038D107D8